MAAHLYSNQIEYARVCFSAGRSVHQRRVDKEAILLLAANTAVLYGSGMQEDTNCVEIRIVGDVRRCSRGSGFIRQGSASLSASASAGSCDRSFAARFRNAHVEISGPRGAKRRKRHAQPRDVTTDEAVKRSITRASLEPAAARGAELKQSALAAHAARWNSCAGCACSSRHAVGSGTALWLACPEIRHHKRRALSKRVHRLFVRTPDCGPERRRAQKTARSEARAKSHTCYDRLAELLGARRPAAHHAQLEHGRDIARHDARLLHGRLHCELHLCG